MKQHDVSIYSISLVREGSVPYARVLLTSSQDVASLLYAYLAGVDREHFVVLLVNRKNRIIGMNTAHIGTLTGTSIHPREVFKPAILGNASAIIVGHNHPSGYPEPSDADRAMTDRLKQAGELLGIELLDHVIIGESTADAYYSFSEQGLLG